MKFIKRHWAIFLLAVAQANAQLSVPASTYTGTANPLNFLWYIITIVGGALLGSAVISLLKVSFEGLFSDHDVFHKLPRIGIFGGIGAGAVAIGMHLIS